MRRFFVSLCLGTAIIAVAGIGTIVSNGSAFAQQLAAAGNAAQASVSTISYQGVLARDGVAVPDGDYTITVALYRDNQGASVVWSGTYVVHTSNGVFNLLLGSGEYPLPAPSQLDGTLFVGVKIGESAELPLTQLSSALNAMNVADGAITAKKMGTDYIGSISINGQRFSTRGGDVNIVTGDGMLATVDQATNSIVLSATGGSSSINGKGATPQTGVSYILNSTSQQSGASFNISGSGQIGTTLTVGGTTTFNGSVTISGSNTLAVGGSSSFGGNVQMNDGLTVSNAPFYTGENSYLSNTTYIHAGAGTGTLLIYGAPQSNSLNPIQIGSNNLNWDGTTINNASISGYAFGITDQLVGDVTGYYYSNTVTGIQSIPVTSNPPSNGQVLAYNSTNNDLEWNTSSGSSGWSLTGNAGTTSGTNFLGTTDAQNLQFRVDSVQAGLIEGDIGAYGNGNTALGYGTLLNNAGQGNTAIGTGTLANNTSGQGNAGNGYYALNNNTSGNYNVASGMYSLASNTTGTANTAIGGYLALYTNTTGSDNTVVGSSSLEGNSTGSGNTAVGFSGMQTNFTGSNNTTLGANADVYQDGLTDATAIGYGAIVDSSYTVQLGDPNVTLVNTYGAINSSTGYQYVGAAPSGHYLRGNGSDYVDGTIQAGDLPDLSGSYIVNGVTQQTNANFNIDGNGTIGGTLYATDIEDVASMTINTTSTGSTTIGNSTGGTWITGTNWSIEDGGGNFTTNGTLSTAGGDLYVDGGGDLATSGSIRVTGGNFTIDGNGNGSFTAAGGDFSVDGSGDIVTSGSLRVTGGDLTIDGSGDLTTSGNLTAGGSLRVTGGNFTVNGNGGGSFSAAAGHFTVDNSGDLATSGSIRVTGGNFTINGNGGGSFSAAAGNFTSDNSGDITVKGSSDLRGPVTMVGLTGSGSRIVTIDVNGNLGSEVPGSAVDITSSTATNGTGYLKGNGSNISFESAINLGSADVTDTLPVTKGGTGTGTQFTQNNIVWAGASGVYSQQNVFVWDDADHRLGVGTATPAVTNGSNITGLTVTSDDAGANTNPGNMSSDAHQLTIEGHSNTNEELELGVNNFEGEGYAFGTIQAYNQGTGPENLALEPAGGTLLVGGALLINADNGNLSTSGTVQFSGLTGTGTNVVTIDGSGYLGSTSLSGSFIDNSNSQQTGANFNIDGNGTIGGTLYATDIEDIDQLNINTTTGNPTQIGNGLIVDGSGDLSTSGSLTVTGGNFTVDGSGNVSANSFSGDGSGLYNLNGSNVNGAVNEAYTADAVSGSDVNGPVNEAYTADAVSGSDVNGPVNEAYTADAVSGSDVNGPVNEAYTADGVSGSDVNGPVNEAYTADGVDGSNVSGEVYEASFADNVYGPNSGDFDMGGNNINDANNITASYFYGDGSNLSNVTTSSVSGPNSGNFDMNGNDIDNVNNLYVSNIYDSPTGINIYGNLEMNGNDIDNGGTFTASFFSGDGSNLSNVTASSVSGPNSGDFDMGGSSISDANNITADYFYGDGSNLSNVTASSVSGPNAGDFDMGGNNINDANNITASYFYGDGSNLTGIQSSSVSGPNQSDFDMNNNDIDNVHYLYANSVFGTSIFGINWSIDDPNGNISTAGTVTTGSSHQFAIDEIGNLSTSGTIASSTSVSPTHLVGDGTGSGTTPSNKYAEQYTVDANTTGYGTNTITISNSNIAGASSVVVASIVKNSNGGEKYISTVVPGTGSITISGDGSDTFAIGDVVSYIIVNP